MSKTFKAALVVVGAIAFSTLAINASDMLRGIDGSLSGLAIEGTDSPCGAHAILLQLGERALCVDMYEASPSTDCPISNPANPFDTRVNHDDPDCKATSEPGLMPWRFVSLTQAQQLCARSGKRLPDNGEWYKAVSGVGDMSSCITGNSSGPHKTGSSECVTPSGVYDMIGNVWEWIEGEVQAGHYDGRELPQSGYVSMVDSEGVAVETTDIPNPDLGADYVWTNVDGVRGMIRGGFYNSGEDAGIYTLNTSVPLDFRATGVGFRCVKDL